MRTSLLVAIALASVAPACDGAPPHPPTAKPSPSAAESAPPSAAPSAPKPASRFVTRDDARALVRELPEVKAYSQTMVQVGTSVHKLDVRVEVTRDADERCRDGSCDSAWEIAVGSADAWSGDKLTEDGLIELYAQVGARDGSLRLHDHGDDAFLDEATWRGRRREQARAARLIRATPEWAAEARASAKTPGRSLGMIRDYAPPVGCKGDEPGCRWTYMALSVCGGCAGHWERFHVDAARETLFVGEGMDPPPYSVWRAETRRRDATTPEYRDLAGPKERFPDIKAGAGKLGYGAPSRVVSDMAKYDAPVRAVLEAEGLRLTRVELYNKGDYPVFFVESSGPYPQREKAAAVRAFAARLVLKNGGYACELAITAPGAGGAAGAPAARYQFDHHAEEAGDAGIYVLIDGAFHPWIGP